MEYGVIAHMPQACTRGTIHEKDFERSGASVGSYNPYNSAWLSAGTHHKKIYYGASGVSLPYAVRQASMHITCVGDGGRRPACRWTEIRVHGGDRGRLRASCHSCNLNIINCHITHVATSRNTSEP